MGINLIPEFAMGKIVGIEEVQKEFGALCNSIGSTAGDIYKEIQERQKAEVQKLTNEAVQHQEKCCDDAEKFLNLYWGGDDKRHVLELQKMREWLNENQPLDRWFFIRLIEAAGQKALEIGYSQHKAEIARKKNAVPREWVRAEWKKRTDMGQSKAAFARQHAALVKSKFGLKVTPETIARDWLLKGET